jgi:hypothetical protein
MRLHLHGVQLGLQALHSARGRLLAPQRAHQRRMPALLRSNR